MIYPVISIPREDNNTRVETGIVQFGNDWPGVFIRGDNAMGYALSLENLFTNDRDGFPMVDPLQKINVDELIKLLHAATATTA